MTEPFSINVRVYFEDTDAGGVVYNANYIKFLERARTDWLRSRNFEQHSMLEEGLGFVVASIEINFRKAAKLDDLLTVTCVPEQLRSASVIFAQKIFNSNGEMVVEAKVKIACVDLKLMRPKLFPENFKTLFQV